MQSTRRPYSRTSWKVDSQKSTGRTVHRAPVLRQSRPLLTLRPRRPITLHPVRLYKDALGRIRVIPVRIPTIRGAGGWSGVHGWAVCYQRSGYPDLGVHTSPFEPLSHLLSPSGPSTVLFLSYKGIQYGFGGAREYSGSGRQRNRAFFSAMVRGVSSPREVSKILSFHVGPD